MNFIKLPSGRFIMNFIKLPSGRFINLSGVISVNKTKSPQGQGVELVGSTQRALYLDPEDAKVLQRFLDSESIDLDSWNNGRH